jgi:hypothetical protein
VQARCLLEKLAGERTLVLRKIADDRLLMRLVVVDQD